MDWSLDAPTTANLGADKKADWMVVRLVMVQRGSGVMGVDVVDPEKYRRYRTSSTQRMGHACGAHGI